MKIFGNEIKVRGSNKLYGDKLDDLDALYQDLLNNSMAQVAKAKGVPANSIRHLVYKYFLPEMIENIKRQRRFHKNNKSGKISTSQENL